MKSWAVALQIEEVSFLSVDEAKAIHERLIRRFGGNTGIRDEGLLESALFRPQSGYYGDISEMAAALFESLLINHAFVDGNKRAAFFATNAFLNLNGWKLAVEPAPAEEFILGVVVSGDARYDKILSWIRESIEETEEST